MTPELLERIRRDFENEPRHSDWDSYLMGYLACLKRFGGQREGRRETKSKLGYSRVGLKNI